MIGFTGYICELYDVDTGKMRLLMTRYGLIYPCMRIGFNKYAKLFYVNGSATTWKYKLVGGLSKNAFRDLILNLESNISIL